jgi:hypothetical protein
VTTDFAACVATQNADYLAVCQCAQGPCSSCARFCQ